MCSEIHNGARRVVVAGLLFRKDKLLICQRSAQGRFPNQWEFPGGKVEPGEHPSDALRRELTEELGIDAEIGEEVWRTEHQYPGFPPLLLLFYAVQGYSPEPENRVFQRIVWARLSDLGSYDFLEADRPLVENLRLQAMPAKDPPETA